MGSIIDKILGAKGRPDLIKFLVNELSGSELNTLLLAVYEERLKLKNNSQVLQDYKKNRFTQPAAVDTLVFRKQELDLLRCLASHGFDISTFSPLTPIGTVAANGKVHQNNVISALRNTEVVSDITNVMALEIAKRIKYQDAKDDIHLAASHRLVRAQAFDHPSYTAHFTVGAMVSGGKDTGNFRTEYKLIIKHLAAYLDIMDEVYGIGIDQLRVQLRPINQTKLIDHIDIEQALQKEFPGLVTILDPIHDPGFTYYHTIRINIKVMDNDIPLIDGGFVDWLTSLTGDRKQRLFISGIGTELMHKLFPSRS